MDNSFEIAVQYGGQEYNFSAEFIPTAYSYRIEVNVFKKIISFEPDEERNFRALASIDDLSEKDMIDKELLATIADQLVQLFRD